MKPLAFELRLRALSRERALEGVALTRQALCHAGAAAVVAELYPRARQLPLVTEHVPACSAGCSHCCYLQVAALVPEVLALADWIHSEGRVDELLPLVRARRALVAELDANAYAASHTPCVFLVDARCSIYDRRPLACRAHNSIKVADCAAPPGHELLSSAVHRFGPGMLMVGAMAELRSRELEPLTVELHGGLEVALTEPDAEARWLAGEPIFAGVALEQGDVGILDALLEAS